MISALLPIYQRLDITFERGEGCYLFDTSNKRYLDFGTGYATLSLGHCHPVVVKALTEQAKKLWHVGNTYRIESQEKLAELMVKHTFADSVFFLNSGSEAVEMSIKMARKYFYMNGQQRYRIITCEGAFHGRTYGAISASRGEKMIKGFAPLLDGFDQVAFGDIQAIENAITSETAAVLLEPIQGEGGIRAFALDDLRRLRRLCDQKGILLIFDEVQTGNGRTGKLYAHEWANIAPDIMATAKGLAGGFPIGACFATEKVASAMVAGSHGSTFGGNPLATTVALATMGVILGEGFLEHVQKMGTYFTTHLDQLAAAYPTQIKERRGIGLIQGLQLHGDDKAMRDRLRHKGLLSMLSSENVLRFLPPLVVEKDHIDLCLDILEKTLKESA